MVSVSKLFENNKLLQQNYNQPQNYNNSLQKEDQNIFKIIKKPIRKIQDIFIGSPDFSHGIAGVRG